MEHEQGIQELGRFARRLAEDLRTLRASVPFGEELFASHPSVERLERPAVAVVGGGAGCEGSSTERWRSFCAGRRGSTRG